MTAIALVLAATALSMPWFKVTTVYEYMVGDNLRQWTTVTYLSLDYMESSSSGTKSYDGLYESRALSEVFGLEKDLIYTWLVTGVLFLAAVLVNSMRGSLVLGWATVMVSLLAVIQFLARIDEALKNSGFPTVNTTHQWEFGLEIVVLAMLFQVGAVLARSYVLYPELAAAYAAKRPMSTS